MFGLLVGTLNKAKTEDKERNATDAVRSSLPGCFFAIWIAQLVIDQCSGEKEADDRAKAPG